MTGDNGLLTKAGNAKESVKDGEIGEQIKLAYQEYELGQYTAESGDLYDFIQGKMKDLCGTNNYILTRMGRNIKIEITGRNKYYILKYNGTLKEKENAEPNSPTNVYAKLSDDGTLYLKATESEGYRLYINSSSIQSDWNTKGDATKDSVIKVIIQEPIAPTTLRLMFAYCSKLTLVENGENIYTKYVTDMFGTFGTCPLLTKVDVSDFDTRNVTSMDSMFYRML